MLQMLERSGLSTLQKLPLSMTLPTWNSSDKHSAERDKSFKKIEQDGMAQRNLLLWSPMQVIGNRQFLFEMGHPLKMDEDGDFPHHSTPRPLHCNDFLPFSASALRRFGQTHSVVKAMRASFFFHESWGLCNCSTSHIGTQSIKCNYIQWWLQRGGRGCRTLALPAASTTGTWTANAQLINKKWKNVWLLVVPASWIVNDCNNPRPSFINHIRWGLYRHPLLYIHDGSIISWNYITNELSSTTHHVSILYPQSISLCLMLKSS